MPPRLLVPFFSSCVARSRVIALFVVGLGLGVSGSGPSRLGAATAPTLAVSLSTSAPIAVSGFTQTFTATVTGATSAVLAWSVDGAASGSSAVGTLSGSGATVTYTPPATPGHHTVTATAARAGTAASAVTAASASLTVTVQLPFQISMSPGSASVGFGKTLALTSTETGAYSVTHSWAVDGIVSGNAAVGTIVGSRDNAVYTAPAAAGSHTVTATASNFEGTRSAACVVRVTSPVVVSLPVPVLTRVNMAGSMLFTAAVTGSSNTAVTWSVDGVASGNAAVGAITAPGPGNTVIYTAPAAAGTHTVTATSVADPSQGASTTVTVASTTVQVANPALVVNVRNAPYNAKGNGVTDDTAAVQAALDAVAGTGGEVTVPAGTYMINPVAQYGNSGIVLGSNMTLSLAPGAVLQALPTSTSEYVIVQLNGVQNVNITGGTIIGNLAHNTITDLLETGMGIQVKASQHVVVEAVTVSNCWADGIYVVAAAQDVTISNVLANHNRRNGMSIVGAREVVVRGSTFENSTGALENGAMLNGTGVDAEPNPGEVIDTVLFSHCSFANNYAVGLGASVPVANTGVSMTTNIFAVGNTVTGNGNRGINMSNFSGAVIANNTCSRNAKFGILFQSYANNGICTGNTVTGTTGAPGNGIDMDTCSGDSLTGNTCTGNVGYGLVTDGCTGLTISANSQSSNGIAP